MGWPFGGRGTDVSILEQETGPSRRSASHFLLLEVATVCRASPPVKYTKLLKLLHLDPENPARCAGGAWWSGAAERDQDSKERSRRSERCARQMLRVQAFASPKVSGTEPKMEVRY